MIVNMTKVIAVIRFFTKQKKKKKLVRNIYYLYNCKFILSIAKAK